MGRREWVRHTFEPVFNARSRVLLLGTMPSPASRSHGFYYSHPQNRFWKTLSALLNEPLPIDAQQKKALLLSRGIALWDVLEACEIDGASDASIQNPVPNDIGALLRGAPIAAVFATGQKAGMLYNRLCLAKTGTPITVLPSSSPANRRVTDEMLLCEYAAILPYLENPLRAEEDR